ncbi:flavin-containing monooxygenase [Coprinopsis sp. MPI-PUGE-AT-0042]|nr:flavin-containing monooxygenase [Coprinopsis sp. MPI-PUGE-AT-0042]
MAPNSVHPAEANLPTLEKLGFATSDGSANPTDASPQPLASTYLESLDAKNVLSIAQSWLKTFADYVSSSPPNIEGIISDLILESKFESTFMRDAAADDLSSGEASEKTSPGHLSAYWRDVLALTWNFRSFESTENIRKFLTDRLAGAEMKNFRLAESGGGDEGFHAQALPPHIQRPSPDLAWIQLMFTFDTKSGGGQGVVKLVPQVETKSVSTDPKVVWKAYTIFTALMSLHGVVEKNPVAEKPTEHSRGGEKEHTKTVLIIGAGQSGLITGARLKSLGVDPDQVVIIDKNERVGDNWRKRYDALKLHDPVWYDHLPYIPFPSDWPVNTPAKGLADWLESYAKALDLDVWTSSEVIQAKQDPGTKKWTVTVNVKSKDGQEEKHTFIVKHLVFASGFVGEPYMPHLPGRDKFKGTVLHSSQHKTGADHAGKKVLVVGACTSAHDICVDYIKHGITPTMYQRSSTYIISGKAINKLLEPLYSPNAPPIEISDLLNMSTMCQRSMAGLNRRFMLSLKEEGKGLDWELLNGLEKKGFKTNEGYRGTGLMCLVWDTASGYYFDFGGSGAIIDGRIKVRGGNGSVAGFSEDGVIFEDGSEEKADVIVFCTGLGNARTGTLSKICGTEVAESCSQIWGLDEEGEIRGVWKELGPEGLWNMMGNLGVCRFHSRHLALQIKAREEGIFGSDDRY